MLTFDQIIYILLIIVECSNKQVTLIIEDKSSNLEKKMLKESINDKNFPKISFTSISIKIF